MPKKSKRAEKAEKTSSVKNAKMQLINYVGIGSGILGFVPYGGLLFFPLTIYFTFLDYQKNKAFFAVEIMLLILAAIWQLLWLF